MGVLGEIDHLSAAVADASSVVAVGSRTQWEVGGPAARDAVEVQAPAGIVEYDPADLTVTVGAGTTCRALADELVAAGQECVLDPRHPDATVGGVLATGLSGFRRLRYGPVRDRLLEVRFVAADGRVVKGGGRTVKNVSGFDLPRLLVGSLGTIGVLVQVTLRCQPLLAAREWSTTADDPFTVRRAVYRPSALLWDGRTTFMLVEGVPSDIEAERAAAGSEPVDASAVPWPNGPHRGRVSVRPAAVRELAPALDATGVRWLAELGVGTVHVAADTTGALAAARSAATALGGWLLREAGAPELDGFGTKLPNDALMRRVREAFDPTGKLARGRLPLANEAAHV